MSRWNKSDHGFWLVGIRAFIPHEKQKKNFWLLDKKMPFFEILYVKAESSRNVEICNKKTMSIVIRKYMCNFVSPWKNKRKKWYKYDGKKPQCCAMPLNGKKLYYFCLMWTLSNFRKFLSALRGILLQKRYTFTEFHVKFALNMCSRILGPYGPDFLKLTR